MPPLPGVAAAPPAFSGISTVPYSLTTLYRMLQNKDVTEILAQPRLVMKNGRSGGFLAGGEFPVVQTLSDSFSVEFKPFGVRLDFVPTLNWSDRIDLRVFPEVSEIDQTVSVQGVPGLKVRRTVNRVEMKEGESLVIGGLLDRRILKDLTKFPLLGDVPILGALFRSTRFRNQETELVFVITPRIVKTMKPGEKPQLPSLEKYDDPDIRQIPLPGASEQRSTDRPSGSRSDHSLRAVPVCAAITGITDVEDRETSIMKLPIYLIGEDSLALASLRQQLEKEPAFFIETRVHNYADAFDHLRSKSGPIVAVIDLNRDEERALAVAAEIKFKLSNVHLVMTAPDDNPQTLLRAMRSGAEEYLSQPFNWQEVLKSFDHIRKKIDVHSSPGRGIERGKIIAVSSNKGGVGATTLAANLASNLAGRNKSVCLVDLVLQFGSVTSFLNIDASYTILDLAKNVKRIDPLLLDGSLVKHSSGVRVLAEPFYAEDARRITPSDIDEILDVLAQSFDFVVVDTAKEFDEMLALVLDKAGLVLFVTEMDVPSLKSAHRAFELFERMGIYDKKIRLILNRYVKSKLMSLESVEKALGVKVFWTLPNNYPTAIAAVNQGLSIEESDPRSDIADSYAGLTTAVLEVFKYPGHGMTGEEDDDKKSGLLSRLIPMRGLLK